MVALEFLQYFTKELGQQRRGCDRENERVVRHPEFVNSKGSPGFADVFLAPNLRMIPVLMQLLQLLVLVCTSILKLCLFASAIQISNIVFGTTKATWDFATDSFRNFPPLISLMLPGKINLSAFVTALASVLSKWASGMPPMQWPWHHRLGPTCHRHIHAGQPHRAISVCWVPFRCSFLLTGFPCLQ